MISPINIIAYHGLLTLKNWSDSSKGERKVYFTMPGHGQNPFSRFTARDGQVAGQRFSVVLNLLDDSSSNAWTGEMMLLACNVTGLSGRTMIFLMSDNTGDHPFCHYKIGMKGQSFAAAFVEMDTDDTPIAQPEACISESETSDTNAVDDQPDLKKAVFTEKVDKNKKPYGEYAKTLHRYGWFNKIEVLRSAGCEDDFHAWLCHQPCLFSGIIEGHDAINEVDFMKVNGQQEYAAIPVCSACHPWNIVPITTRDKYVKKWAEEKIAKRLAVTSLGFAHPDALVDYADKNGLMHTLPMAYRQNKPAKGSGE